MGEWPLILFALVSKAVEAIAGIFRKPKASTKSGPQKVDHD